MSTGRFRWWKKWLTQSIAVTHLTHDLGHQMSKACRNTYYESTMSFCFWVHGCSAVLQLPTRHLLRHFLATS
jgi:hypothetical protein